MTDPVTLAAFATVLGATSLLALFARWLYRSDRLPLLEGLKGWALAGQQCGAVIIFFLLGGSVFTSYTFAAVPGLVYGTGALAFFALPYVIILCPLLFVLLPRLRSVAEHPCDYIDKRDDRACDGHVTVADYVGHHYKSSGLALAVALTGILATLPYLALQLLGIRAVLSAGGIYPRGFTGDLILVAVFAILAGATYRSGLRAPAVISLIKGALIFGAALGVVAVAVHRLGSPGAIFDAASSRFHPSAPGFGMLLDPSLYSAFASLALGSALALPAYPHVLTVTFAAADEDSLRRSIIGLPAWTAVLGAFGLLAIAALAAGISAPPGNAEAAVPLLVAHLMPSILSGAIFGALAVGALVPAAVMSISIAALFVRNIYFEYFFRRAAPKTQVKVARVVSLSAKVGALGFVFGLRDQDAINLQLLGGVWILQTAPAVVLGLFSTWFHPRGLVAGWAVGMVAGTLMVVSGGFSSVVNIGTDRWPVQLYAALVALIINLTVAAVLTLVMQRYDPESPRPPAGDT